MTPDRIPDIIRYPWTTSAQLEIHQRELTKIKAPGRGIGIFTPGIEVHKWIPLGARTECRACRTKNFKKSRKV